MSEDSEFLPLFSIDDQDGEELEIEDSLTLPVLALKNTVLFPGVVIPITIGRAKSIKAVNKAHDSHRMIAVLSQRSTKTEDPNREDLFGIGTVAKLVKLLRMPDGTVTAILQGRHRFQLEEMTAEEPYLEGRVNTQEEVPPEDQLEFKALIATLRDKAKEVVELSPNIPSEAVMMLGNITDDSFLLNFIASNMGLKIEAIQHILELDQPTV